LRERLKVEQANRLARHRRSHGPLHPGVPDTSSCAAGD
jgi:hypothetical protein